MTTLLFFDSSGISRLTAITITSTRWYYLSYAHYNTKWKMDKLVKLCNVNAYLHSFFLYVCNPISKVRKTTFSRD
ncbi:hypothetical protein LM80661_190137 [Listeria monocytogenes]|nr:hypothetical protein LM77097_430136 [Listeria monocytogenes]CUL75231.1 hypothetical protein LM80661_190137 [Listeria monocytogenes]CUM03509.1 hypothetical protein LM900521_170137 [Listeria monocytogenes]CUM25781.1 hypothetical protein LM901004_220136 [Listeria monocytogenes]